MPLLPPLTHRPPMPANATAPGCSPTGLAPSAYRLQEPAKSGHAPGPSSPAAGAGAANAAQARGWRAGYLTALAWAFTLFNVGRVLSYLPTLAALVESGDSSQHSLWTWGTWAAANLTMAAWLYEQQGQRWSHVVTINVVNAWMCAVTFVVIAALRL